MHWKITGSILDKPTNCYIKLFSHVRDIFSQSDLKSENLDYFFAKGSWSVHDDTVTKRADITGFASTIGYNVTPHYWLLCSLHFIEIFKKLAAENRGEILLIMIPGSVKHRFSKMRRRGELSFFPVASIMA